MLVFTGLEPSIIQSGTLDYKDKMVKHSSSHLRYSPIFYDYYLKKCSEGKCHRVALSHVCNKLIIVNYSLEKNDIDFNPSLLK